LAQELASIAARAQTYTGASGAAIALSEGDVAEMVCRACSGPSAPDVGAHLRLEGTFTGMAVQSGQALRCDDSDTDNRVDAAACRALGTRSIVVVPIRDMDTEAVTGVLAVFAGNRNTFNDLHVAVLRTMAREVAVAVQKARKAGISVNSITAAPPPPRHSDPGFTPPAATTSRPGPVPVPTPIPGAAAAPKLAPEIAPTMMSPAPKLAAPVPPPPPVEDPHAPQPMAAHVAPSTRKTFTAHPTPEWKPAPPPPPRKVEPIIERTAEKRGSRPMVASFGTFDSVAEDKKPGGGGMGIWIGVGIAAVVVVGGYFGYSALSSKAEPQAQTQPAPAATTASTPEPTAEPAATQSASQPTPTQAPAKPAAQPAPQPATRAASKPPTPEPPPPAPEKKQPQAVERAAVTPSAQTRVEEPPKAIAALPQIQVPITTAAPTLAAPKISQSTVAELVSRVNPAYPASARALRVEGTVLVEAAIGKDGVVKSVRVISGHTLLRDAAAQAVRQWRYKPATLNGQPIESTSQVTLKFSPPR
jgi:TonB family protein